MGKPAGEVPHGTENAGNAREIDGHRVNIGEVHLEGIAEFFAQFEGRGVGDTGEAIRSQVSYARAKSRQMSVRTCCALR